MGKVKRGTGGGLQRREGSSEGEVLTEARDGSLKRIKEENTEWETEGVIDYWLLRHPIFVHTRLDLQ